MTAWKIRVLRRFRVARFLRLYVGDRWSRRLAWEGSGCPWTFDVSGSSWTFDVSGSSWTFDVSGSSWGPDDGVWLAGMWAKIEQRQRGASVR